LNLKLKCSTLNHLFGGYENFERIVNMDKTIQVYTNYQTFDSQRIESQAVYSWIPCKKPHKIGPRNSSVRPI
jgi:hypothetical protein